MTSHTWRLFLAFGLAAAVVYFLLPNDVRVGAASSAVLHHIGAVVSLGVGDAAFLYTSLPDLADADDLDAVGRHLFDRGIYVTLAPYPVVPRREVGFRIQVTAANTAEQVDHLLAVLEELDDRFGFRRPHL